MSSKLLAFIEQGYLVINERKKVFELLHPISFWLCDRETRDALMAEARAAYGEMLALGYQLK